MLAEDGLEAAAAIPRGRGLGPDVAAGGDVVQEVDEPVEVGGLVHVRGRAELARPGLERALAEPGEQDDAGRRRAATHRGEHLEPAEPRHRHVEQEDVGPLGRHGVERLLPRPGLADDVEPTVQAQAGTHEGPELGRVVDDDDPGRLHRRGPRVSPWPGRAPPARA